MFCSPECRRTNLPRGGLIFVDVDYEIPEGYRRPTGRVWRVKLRRGNDEVVIATELGLPSAKHLAGQISQLIERPERAQGGTIE
jgi:hypothetical protein